MFKEPVVNMASRHFAGEDSEGGEGEEDEIVKGGGYEDEDQSMMDSDGAEKDDDDDFDPDTGGGKKKKKSKKHKSRNEDKKSKKKKKKKKVESADPSEAEEEQPVDEPVSKKKPKAGKAAPAQTAAATDSGMPSVEEVCTTFGLVDVQIDYDDAEYQNLNNYKLFQQHVRPLLQKENPKVFVNSIVKLFNFCIHFYVFCKKVPMSKLMMLVAAKWREFSASIPEGNDTPAEEEAAEASSSRPLRSSRSAASGREEPEIPEEEEDDDDEFAEKGRKKRSRKPTKGGNTNAGKKGKVPTIKIKLGKRKRTSSDDVSADEKDSDAEFEQMLKEAEEASKVVEESKGEVNAF